MGRPSSHVGPRQMRIPASLFSRPRPRLFGRTPAGPYGGVPVCALGVVGGGSPWATYGVVVPLVEEGRSRSRFEVKGLRARPPGSVRPFPVKSTWTLASTLPSSRWRTLFVRWLTQNRASASSATEGKTRRALGTVIVVTSRDGKLRRRGGRTRVCSSIAALLEI